MLTFTSYYKTTASGALAAPTPQHAHPWGAPCCQVPLVPVQGGDFTAREPSPGVGHDHWAPQRILHQLGLMLGPREEASGHPEAHQTGWKSTTNGQRARGANLHL